MFAGAFPLRARSFHSRHSNRGNVNSGCMSVVNRFVGLTIQVPPSMVNPPRHQRKRGRKPAPVPTSECYDQPFVATDFDTGGGGGLKL